MCISKVPANSFNFIRWHQATGLAITNLASPIAFCAADPVYLPNNIVKYERNSFPVVIDGKNISFYANLTTTISDADFADWVLAVYDTFGNQVLDNVAPIIQDLYSGGDYRFYCNDFTVDGLAKGRYRFVVYNSNTSNAKYVSNCFDYRLAADISQYPYLSYRHNSVLFNFNYTTLTSFRNKIFILMNDIETQPEIEIDGYNEITTGKASASKTYSKVVRTLETGFFDFEMQRAMLALSAHSNDGDILINGQTFEVKEAYQQLPSRGNSLKKGTISFYEQAVSTINLSGYDV